MYNNPTPFSNWKKSSKSGDGPTCVELATTAEAEGIRDSKSPDGTFLTFPLGTHARLIQAALANAFITVQGQG